MLLNTAASQTRTAHGVQRSRFGRFFLRPMNGDADLERRSRLLLAPSIPPKGGYNPTLRVPDLVTGVIQNGEHRR